jgi:hypothetical protein
LIPSVALPKQGVFSPKNQNQFSKRKFNPPAGGQISLG